MKRDGDGEKETERKKEGRKDWEREGKEIENREWRCGEGGERQKEENKKK